MGAVARVQNAVEAQRHQAMLWAPVALALGIGGYFALPVEPSFAVRTALLIVSLLAMALAARARATLCLLLLLVPLGIGVTADRAARLAAPVIDGRYYGPILGQVVHVDRSSSNALRVTLEPVYLPGRKSLPQRVRVSSHGGEASAHPGDWIATTGHLSAPSGPAEPGGFDFRRYAWFQRLGAVGYTRSPVLHSDPPAGHRVQPVPLARLRMALADWIRAQMPARTGGFAAAILVGDRSSLDPKDVEALRATNLAHLLAISGLHMGLVTGCVFLVVRRGLVLVPGMAERYPVKKWAALCAMVVALVYLGLSGASIATQRAFIMALVMLGAILADRPAFTLRAVALAALVVLVLRPESLLSPGFQMSFAATTALVWVFASLRGTGFWTALQHRRARMLRPFVVLLISSSVAGAATAPFAAFHFNQMSQYGLMANLLAVPAMGMVVMPSALLGLVLAPFGGAALGFWVMDQGITFILTIAEVVSNWPEAVWRVPSGPALALPLLSLGVLWGLLWDGRARWSGLVVVSCAVAFWASAKRPDVLVSADARLVGVETAQGRALSRAKGAGFVAARWLENDGDTALQGQAFTRKGFDDRMNALGLEVSLDARGGLETLTIKNCETPPCLWDAGRLAQQGALAIWATPKGLRLVSGLEKDAHRPWGRKPDTE